MTFNQDVSKDKEKNPKTEPDKDPDEADKKPDKTRVGGHDRAAKTRDREQLEGPHMFHTTKYRSEDLLGMNTKVCTVKGTTGGEINRQWRGWRTQELSINHFMGSSKETEHGSVWEG